MSAEKDDPGEEETRSPEEIRSEIEDAREELNETVAAVADKADLKKQARKKVDELRGSAQERVEELRGSAQEAAPESAGQGFEQARQAAEGNPMLAIAGALVVGFVLGRLTSR